MRTNMNRTKLVATVILTVAALTMITSNQLAIQASAVTEDDGYTYPDDATEEEKEEIDEQEQEAWEDAGRPGNTDNDDNDDNDDNEEQVFTCSDGSTVTEDEECPSTRPNPYCDTDRGKAAPVCHDRLDYDQNSGLYPCNDGTSKVDWRDCKDATSNNNDDDDDSTKTIQTTTTISNSAESSCRLDGTADGIQQKFDSIKYQACGLYTNGQKAYSDGFIVGCSQVGNTQLICQALVDSSILNAKIQPTQTQNQTVTQPTQTIQSTAVDANNCRSSGFEDGINSGFNVNAWLHCGADQLLYYEGFVSGCTYYDAFTADYCENWADGSIK